MTYPEMIRLFGRIGCLSFGGPAAQIALMQKELVEDRPLLGLDEFLKALSFCMLLPGPEAMQLATYAGWKLRGVLGGLIAGGLFVLPGALVITVLAFAYAKFGALPLVQAAFLGIKATVIIIVLEAIIRLLGKALSRKDQWIIAGAAFLALFVFDIPFPIVVFGAALYGAITCSETGRTVTALPWRTTFKPVFWGVLLWSLPLLSAWAAKADFLLAVGLFFSKLALVTFGGAYAVLAYMTQTVVADFGWLNTAQMIDALGLAETTPGPLILVTQFAAILAGLEQGDWVLGLLAGAMTLWVTFVPCFIWIFAGAPLIDWLDGFPRVRAALAAITAAVVGVIANLSLWFAAHVVFGDVGVAQGPFRVLSPVWSTFDPSAAMLIVLAAALLIWRKSSLFLTLPVMAIAGMAVSVFA